MINCLISVIVPAYNIETLLPRCLDSIINQTYQNLEIIVVDDGSTDSTGCIADDYALKDNRIRVIHQKNAGLSGARNAGLDVINGEYIGYVDGDDYIEPNMYEDMINAVISSGSDMALCAYRQIGKGASCYSYSGQNFVMSSDETLHTYICDDRDFHIYNSVWSKLFKKAQTGELRFPAGRNSEDIMYTTKALCMAEKCVFVDKPLYNYVLDRDGSIMNEVSLCKYAARRFNDEIPFWKEQTSYLRGLNKSELADMSEYYFYRRMLYYYIDFRDKKDKESAKKLSDMLRNERENIRRIYEGTYATKGDKSRMKQFLSSPGRYYFLSKLYEKTVVRIKNLDSRNSTTD